MLILPTLLAITASLGAAQSLTSTTLTQSESMTPVPSVSSLASTEPVSSLKGKKSSSSSSSSRPLSGFSAIQDTAIFTFQGNSQTILYSKGNIFTQRLLQGTTGYVYPVSTAVPSTGTVFSALSTVYTTRTFTDATLYAASTNTYVVNQAGQYVTLYPESIRLGNPIYLSINSINETVTLEDNGGTTYQLGESMRTVSVVGYPTGYIVTTIGGTVNLLQLTGGSTATLQQYLDPTKSSSSAVQETFATITATAANGGTRMQSDNGLSVNDKVIIGCVVGLAIPVLCGMTGISLWFIDKRRKYGVDHEGKKWALSEMDDTITFDGDGEKVRVH